MKAVILAGGLGTRLSEETSVRPKPMVEIGGHPILWHVMKIYASHGISDFVICAGYKGDSIKRYFAEYFMRNANVTFDLAANRVTYHDGQGEPWKVTVVDTGRDTMTGGRLKRVASFLDDETFCMTYGDGVGNVDIGESIRMHRRCRRDATLTAVQPPGRFGALRFDAQDADRIGCFREKPVGDDAWINGGFFVLEPSVIDRIDGDSCIWEQAPLRGLADDGQLTAFRHPGFWRPMDTLRDKMELEKLCQQGTPPWFQAPSTPLRIAA
ncbi:glucose-1-phosphate cytidylyltransferase [Crateriforma conspicua]|uniref:Glucose-1-phosphate cytidylyltransferase n=1 Tax=Crateriforma conspicua TaxID=2527996 RepID=A0A5C5YDK8_9PLAN|nr:glucose-1-phosphate cytidylyltransferase [Crateriforma conspicua]QDV61217.1 Glucose-1-phosphate cytidylyltransferase [Crateriforma conspicua]TWT72531.1 Glucose-1-phosphate cytidylyltransferase [Crateriforma conspicua]